LPTFLHKQESRSPAGANPGAEVEQINRYEQATAGSAAETAKTKTSRAWPAPTKPVYHYDCQLNLEIIGCCFTKK
jgi:hypothetical protein